MRKMIAGLAAGFLLAVGGVASADFEYPNYGGYDLHLTVNGAPFYGKWAIVDDRPYVGLEALSDALQMSRKHYYKAWNLEDKADETGDPLKLMTTADEADVNTIRFGGVTMVDLYSVAAALDIPVHHNFRTRTIQVGDEYEGAYMPGEWYRYKARVRNWRGMEGDRFRYRYRERGRDREWDDTAPEHGEKYKL